MLFTFAGTIANLIDEDWNLLERVVDFCCLNDDERTGVGGARAFFDSVHKIGGGCQMSHFEIPMCKPVLTDS